MSEELLDINPKFDLEVLPLINHIKHKLLLKNIHYTPNKIDYSIIKYIIKLFNSKDKTGYSVIKFIDESLDKVEEFNGLSFLGSMARQKFNIKFEKKRYKTKVNSDVVISDSLKNGVKDLKKKYGL